MLTDVKTLVKKNNKTKQKTIEHKTFYIKR